MNFKRWLISIILALLIKSFLDFNSVIRYTQCTSRLIDQRSEVGPADVDDVGDHRTGTRCLKLSLSSAIQVIEGALMIDLRLLRSERRQSSPLFWARYPGLVWSNCRADDLAYIFAALLKPHFDIILDICVEFGLEWVEAEWQALLLHGEAAKVNRASVTLFHGNGHDQ